MMARERVVRALMSQVSSTVADACLSDRSVTADEIFSAYLTLARNVVIVARKKGADMNRIRGVVESILMECVDDRKAS